MLSMLLTPHENIFAEGAEPLPRGLVADRAPVLFLAKNARARGEPGQTYRVQVLEGVGAQDVGKRR